MLETGCYSGVGTKVQGPLRTSHQALWFLSRRYQTTAF